jgi:hypothetical protein
MLYIRNSWQVFKGLYRLFKAYSDYDRLIFIQKLTMMVLAYALYKEFLASFFRDYRN